MSPETFTRIASIGEVERGCKAYYAYAGHSVSWLDLSEEVRAHWCVIAKVAHEKTFKYRAGKFLSGQLGWKMWEAIAYLIVLTWISIAIGYNFARLLHP